MSSLYAYLLVSLTLSAALLRCGPLPIDPATNPEYAAAEVVEINGAVLVQPVIVPEDTIIQCLVQLKQAKFIEQITFAIEAEDRSFDTVYHFVGGWKSGDTILECAILFPNAGVKRCIVTARRSEVSPVVDTIIFSVNAHQAVACPEWIMDTISVSSVKGALGVKTLGDLLSTARGTVVDYSVDSAVQLPLFRFTDDTLFVDPDADTGMYIFDIVAVVNNCVARATVRLTVKDSVEYRLYTDTLLVAEYSTTALLPLKNDLNGSGLHLKSVFGTKKGEAAIRGDTIFYTPREGVSGADTGYYLVDAVADTGVIVLAITSARFFIKDDTVSVTVKGIRTIDVIENDSISSGALVLHMVSGGKNGTAKVKGQQVEYTSLMADAGTDTLIYTVNGGRDSGRVFITALPIVIIAKKDMLHLDEDAAATAVDVLANDSISAGETVLTSVSDGKLGTAVIVGGKVVYTPFHDANGADTVVYYVNNAVACSLMVAIRPVNDLPAAIDQDVATSEDTLLEIKLSVVDPDGALIVSWEISRQPKQGTLTGSGSMRTYTPAQDFFGTDTFMFRGNDGVNWSDTGIVMINVLPVNDAPVWKQGTVEIPVQEGRAVSLDLTTVFDNDPEGNLVLFSKKSGVGTVTGTTWSWTPGFSAAAASPASCIITATDNSSPVKGADITLMINVSDSLCRLTRSVATGKGTISASGTMFDPGAVVQVTANADTDHVFKSWSGDVPSVNQSAAVVSITMNGDKIVTATFVKSIETVTLNIGESFVHGSLFTNGYYFLSTRTSPAKLLRLNADNLADYKEITFSSGHGCADQLTYVESKKKVYAVFGSYYQTVIAEVDPVTMAFNENAIVDTVHGASPDASTGGQSMTNDGEYLYVVTARADTSRVLKYSLTTMSSIPVAVCSFSTANKYAHAIRFEDGKLYVTNGNGIPWVARLNASTLQIEAVHEYTGMAFTDDFAIYNNYLFLGVEADYAHEQSGKILRVDKKDLSSYYYFDTGKKGGDGAGAGYNYSIQEFNGTLWTVFATNPGVIVRINPVSLEYQNFTLPYGIPNEIVTDGRRILITYWDQNPGVVQAIAPEYFK